MVCKIKVHSSTENDDFIKSIRLIQLCQSVGGLSRVLVKGNDIYRRCTTQNVLLFCWVCLASYAFYVSLTFTSEHNLRSKTSIFMFCLSAISLYIEVILLIMTSKDTVHLMKTCQDIGRMTPKLNKRWYKDWIAYVTIFKVIHFTERAIITIVNLAYTKNIEVITTKHSFSTLVSYMNELDVLTWIRVCNYVKDQIQAMNAVIRESSKSGRDPNFKSQNWVYFFERCTFSLIKVLKIYRWSLMFYYINFLIWAMFLFHNLSIETMDQWENLVYTVFKKLLLIAVISYTTESYKKVCDETAQICYDILDNHDRGELKDFADVALYLIREMPPATQVGGMLHLDYKLFFQFVSQLITNTVIILQFSNFKST